MRSQRLNDIVARAARRGGRIVFPEPRDVRILAAARQLVDESLARPVLLGPNQQISDSAAAAGVSIEGVEQLDPTQDAQQEDYISGYLASRPRSSRAIAKRLLRKPLYYGAAMVKAGHADALVAGASQPTARVIEAGKLMLGLSAGVDTPSSFFLMLLPERTLIFADCALNIQPDSHTLADIGVASARSAANLLEEVPRVAFLSFSTASSTKHESVDRVSEAVEIAQQRAPEFHFGGALQADSALVSEIARKKGAGDDAVAGRANVLIFPDLNSGNIAYKLVQHLAGGQAIGPICQGFAAPLCDLSRGASVDDIVAASMVTLGLSV